jgi:hypothetical protein
VRIGKREKKKRGEEEVKRRTLDRVSGSTSHMALDAIVGKTVRFLLDYSRGLPAGSSDGDKR